MDFQVNCQCGQHLMVTEGSAGATIRCSCGRFISIPSLKELRTSAGLSPYDPSPELVIEHLLATGELPSGNCCVECGIDTDEIIHVVTECERTWIRRRGGFSWAAFLISVIFLPMRILYWEEREEKEFGRDKIYSLPLPVCGQCQRILRNQKRIKQCLREVPEYCKLLDKFPGAKVTVCKGGVTKRSG